MSDWQGRARREATAIIAGVVPPYAIEDYEQTVMLVAIGWLQGVNVGSHEALVEVEDAFKDMRATL